MPLLAENLNDSTYHWKTQGLGQVLQRLALAAHDVVAHAGRDVHAALAEVKVQRLFVPVQDGEVELVAAGGEAQLEQEDRRGNIGDVSATISEEKRPAAQHTQAAVFGEEDDAIS
ncbi:hypothetical protein EYF80_017721 [Liparis tanakae]|uniref:Uncharacterized protein n=1 Tax=Liparis tanakae TaxID=230148 RepID=A0A4Z2I3W9_9TELE|nr:hypothetical protein EYF80_017721 [Liparis tanakae]